MKVTIESVLDDTVEEIDITHKRLFVKIGGERYEINSYRSFSIPDGCLSILDGDHSARAHMAAFASGGTNIMLVGKVRRD